MHLQQRPRSTSRSSQEGLEEDGPVCLTQAGSDLLLTWPDPRPASSREKKKRDQEPGKTRKQTKYGKVFF